MRHGVREGEAMMRHAIRTFPGDEDGASTILAIFWFILFCGIGGLAVDITNGYRVQTSMQAAADASAHAALIDLPDEAAAVATALEYAEINLPSEIYGTVLTADDVQLGLWVPQTRTFLPGAPSPNAVRVFLRSTEARGNPVWTSLLRIIGWQRWNVVVAAIAAYGEQACYNDGLLTLGLLDMEGEDNHYTNHICLHGEEGVDLQVDNTFDPGVSVTMPEGDDFVHPSGVCEKNTGLCTDPDPETNTTGALGVDSMADQIQSQLDKITPTLDALLSGDATQAEAALPAFMFDGSGNSLITNYEVQTVSPSFRFNEYEEGHVYHVECNSAGQQTDLAVDSHIKNIVVISDCILNNGKGTLFENVVLGSTAVGSGDKPLDLETIHLASDVRLGTDECELTEDGQVAPEQNRSGGVAILSEASIKTASGTEYKGVQMYAKGHIELTAGNEGIHGIAAYSGDGLHLTTGNSMASIYCGPVGGGGSSKISYALVD